MIDHSLPVLLHATQEAYTTGARKTAIDSRSSIDQNERALHANLYGRFPVHEQTLLNRISNLRMYGLNVARKGNLEIADQILQEAHTLLRSENFSPEGILYDASMHEAAMAYIDYRRSNFDLALSRVHKALAIDQTLEDEYGLPYMHLHRIRLILNLIRIYRLSAQQEQAIQMGFHLMGYLEGKVPTLPAPTNWDSTRITSFPPVLLDSFFSQTAVELAFMAAGSENTAISELFTSSLDHTQSASASCCYLARQTHDWLKVKQTLIENDIFNFLASAEQFLSAGRGDTPILWYAVIIDLLFMCQKMALPEEKALRENITKDAASWAEWKSFPKSWKSVLDINT